MARPKPRRSGQAGQVMRGSGGIRQTTRDRCVRIRFLHAYELSITAKTGTTATKNLEEDARTHHPPPEPPQLPKGCKRTKGHAATASQAYSTAPCGVASVPSRSPASFNVVREKVEMVRLLSPMSCTRSCHADDRRVMRAVASPVTHPFIVCCAKTCCSIEYITRTSTHTVEKTCYGSATRKQIA